MISDFRKKQEEKADKIAEALLLSFNYNKHFAKYTRQKTRIAEAMENEEQGKIMIKCSSGGDACGSIFCDRCLDKRQRNMLATYNNYIKETFSGDEKLARDRLRWITILHNVIKVNTSSFANENNTINECFDSSNELKNKIRNLSRNNKSIWMRGAIHAELIDYSLYEYFTATGGATNKVETISDFIQSNGFKDHNSNFKDTMFDSLSGEKELYFLIHFHALADVGNYTDKLFRKKLTDKWNITDKQVDVRRIWEEIELKNGTIKHKFDDSLKGMSRYCYTRSNAGLTFSKDWGAGEKIMSTYIKVDEDIGKEGWGYDYIEKRYYKQKKYKSITYAKEMKDRDLDKDISLSVGELRLLIMVHNAISGSNNDGLNVSIYKRKAL